MIPCNRCIGGRMFVEVVLTNEGEYKQLTCVNCGRRQDLPSNIPLKILEYSTSGTTARHKVMMANGKITFK